MNDVSLTVHGSRPGSPATTAVLAAGPRALYLGLDGETRGT